MVPPQGRASRSPEGPAAVLRLGVLAVAVATLSLSLASLRALLDASSFRRVVAGMGAACAVCAAAVGLLPSERLASLVTVLHEGRNERAIEALFGRDHHVGPLWSACAAALTRPGHVPILDLVRCNLLLTAAAAAALGAVAGLATGKLGAAVITFGLFVTSRGALNGAFSETPAPLLWCLTLAATPAWTLLERAVERPRRQRLLAFGTLALCALEAACTRSECALLGAPFVVLGAAHAAGRPQQFEDALALARRGLAALACAAWPARLAALAWVIGVPSMSRYLDFTPKLLLNALWPFTPSSARIPVALLALAPFAVVMVATVGAVASLRANVGRVTLVLSVLSMHGVYLTACHGVGWEMFRYAMLPFAAVWLLAILGWLELERYAAGAAWPRTWRWWIACLGLLLSTVASSDPAEPGWWDDDVRKPTGPLIGLSEQQAARLLLEQLRQAPRCVFVARVRTGGMRYGAPMLAVFGTNVGLSFVNANLPVRLAAARADAPCVRYYWSLDCNMLEGPSCVADIVGARPIQIWRGRHAVYSDSAEYGPLTPEVVFGVWSLDDAPSQ